MALSRPAGDTGRGGRVAGATIMYFVFACIAVLQMPLSQYSDTRENVGTRCLAGYVPPDAVVGEAPLREARVTGFPAGRYCEWDSVSGGVTGYQAGWTATGIALAATLLVIWTTALAIRERRPRRRAIALIPVVLTAASWVVVLA